MAALSAEQIRRLHAAIVSARLTDSRTALLGRIDPTVVDGLPIVPNPSGQILSDLNTLNEALLLDGSSPIKTWLENAATLAGGRVEAQVFHELLGSRPRSGVAAPPFLVPFPQNPSFVGRSDDVEALHALLQTNGGRPAALTGMGGVGKTQLAVEYVYRHRDAYPGGIYWVNAAQGFQAGLSRLAEQVDLREDNAPESDRQRRLALAFARYLKACREALLVFDNVDDPRALHAEMLAFVPAGLGCRLLFTTRRRDLRAPFVSVEVGALLASAALELLLSTDARRDVLMAGAEADRVEAAAICKALGYLPLALVLAAAYLDQNPEIALGDYRGRLAREGALATLDDSEIEAFDLGTRHDAAVGATLRLSWDALKSNEAKQVVQAAALLGEAAQVPRARLSLLVGLRDRAEAGYPSRLGSALRKLRDLSLVEDLTERDIRLHPLVREFAERKIEGLEAFAATCAERLREALSDMGRLQEEVVSRGIYAVLGDLRAGASLAGDLGKAPFERLSRPLDREAHCLRGWDPARQPGFLLQQLRNRSFEMALEDVQRRCEAELAARRWPHLCERIRTSRESEALVRTLEGHTGWVVSVALTSDGHYAVSASYDRTLKVWDLSTAQAVYTLEGHTGWVIGVAVTADGRNAVSASADNTLKVWDLLRGKELRTLKGHKSAVSRVAVTTDGRAVSASWDRTLKVWDLSTGQAVRTLEGHTDLVTDVALMADGRHAVSASADATLKVWDLSSGQALRTLRGHTERVAGVALTADDRYAVSASSDRTLKVWELSTGTLVHTLEGHTSFVCDVAVTSDGLNAVSASSDGTLKVWELSSGAAIRTLEGHTAGVFGVAVAADGRHVVSASRDATLNVWDLSTGQTVHTLEGHTTLVTGVAVSADGRHAVSASADRTLKVWDLSNGKVVRVLTGHTDPVTGVALTADGKYAVSASDDRTLKVWDLASGEPIRTLEGHTHWVTGVAVTSDGRTAVSTSDDRTLKVWDLASGRAIRTLEGHTDFVRSVAVTADASLVVSASRDGTLRVWSLSSGQTICTLEGHTHWVTGVAVTFDDRHAVSASRDRSQKVWDLSNGQVVHTLHGHTDDVNCVAVTADGQSAVSASSDRTLMIWDLATGRPVVTLETHAPLHSCAVTPDGKTLIVGDSVGGVHILDWVRP